MKKIFILLLALAVMFTFSSCGLLIGGVDDTEMDGYYSDGSIAADTWYTSSQINSLNFQNCVIYNAVASGDKAIVSYYPVCRKCHTQATKVELSAPEFNYDINENYTCPECFTVTTVRLKLS